MLDTRFKQYQDAIVGTVLTTLHAGSVLLTFYPNFNLSLQDTKMSTALKVQVQIQGAEQISSAKMATLHHQLVYRLQNHALDLPTPDNHSDALMVLVESDQIPTIIQIPRQIPHHELIKLMPLEWISNYEKFHNNSAPIQTSESMFERRPDGTVRMNFQPPPSTSQPLPSAPQEPPRCDPNCPYWDDWEEDDQDSKRKRKPKKKIHSPCNHTEAKPPYGPPPPLAPVPIYKKELETFPPNLSQTSTPQPVVCMMFSSSSKDYSFNFPSLEAQSDSQKKVMTKPFIPSAITSAGHLKEPKPFESVLNWQTENARAQNDTLVDIHKRVDKINLQTDQVKTKVDSITLQMQQIYQDLQSIISQLDADLRVMLSQRYYGPEFDQKEREIRRLKAELDQIESEKHRPTHFTKSPPIPTIKSKIESSISTIDSEGAYADITKLLMAQPKETEPAQPSQPESYFEIPSNIDEPVESSTHQPPQPQAQNTYKPSNGPWFTFDDIPTVKWRKKLTEMSAWVDLQMIRLGATIELVLKEFVTCFTGSLRDWFDSLGPYRQLQFVQLPNISSALAILHEQFIGEPSAVFEVARRDYLNMKCCYLNTKDLDFHYKRMSILFYKLNGFNDHTLKHVFLASLPEELQPEIQRQLTVHILNLGNISLGKIFHIAKGCLEKLCEQK
ncbi:hypothetical protein KPL71_004253 [Citrus sinensis]|uniref:Uncharacterized protein n=1 Tax=Citrus sinensis TaxID=2711 RepID=A0ACB8N4H1_CITSI|nr:hypothetical protein KPL71_004253 [Citrus sinensis]